MPSLVHPWPMNQPHIKSTKMVICMLKIPQQAMYCKEIQDCGYRMFHSRIEF